ncbi:hypothetical protein O6H91_05G052400 [Diphasiastrum complanatum]|uniref:Uncharacterized protein n=1 Tax=Diphasiastrum complanatum TaxID=34168 RepID=A0ACC2DNM0_DIPCM|nr:hypothetical protein O6H91_Y334800 [Diphasiastrum complanatum]KAJ7555730.1 hypothetical protein O6H91_05G052400 [Diphasiastrum complanatum]
MHSVLIGSKVVRVFYILAQGRKRRVICLWKAKCYDQWIFLLDKPNVPHEQQLQVFQQESRNSPGSSSSSRNDALLRETSHQTRVSVLLQGQSENNLRGPALEARDRLDERLRAAALVNRRHTDTSLPRLAEHFFNAVFSDDDEELLWDEEEWEMSMREWLAGQAPSFRDSWQSEWTIGTGRSGSFLKGMSKSDMDCLPKEVFQQAGGKHSESSTIVECSICLESFVAGQTLFCLPCNHRFHPQCLTPWLEGHTQCPYCRAKASVSQSDPCSSSTSRDDSELQQTDLVSWLSAFETGIHRLSFQPQS